MSGNMNKFREKIKKLVAIPGIMLLFFYGCDREISTTSPDPDPGNNTLFVNSTPEGYSIYLNNRISGYTTPDSIPFLTSGDYTVSLKHEVYNDSTLDVSLSENEIFQLDIDFTRSASFYSTLDCKSSYDGASIYIDGVAANAVTPAIISGIYPGSHMVSIAKLGYLGTEKQVFLRSNITTEVYFNLVDTTIWLVYNTDNSQLVSNSLHCIGYNSSAGNSMWIGTDDQGVMDINGQEWMNYNVSNSIIPANFISVIGLGEDEKIFICTLNGIAFYNNGEWSSVNNSNQAISSHVVMDLAYEPTSYNVITGAVYNPELIVFATDNGVIRYSQGSWSEETALNNLLPSRNLTSISYQGSFNSVQWVIGTRDSGVFVMDTYSNHEPITYNMSNAGFISNLVTDVEMIKPTHEFYAGVKVSSGINDAIGMLYFQDASRYWYEINLDFAVINRILVNFESTWVATNNGLYRLVNRTQIADHYTKDNSPLQSNNIYDLKLDRANNLWMATGKGLVRFKLN